MLERSRAATSGTGVGMDEGVRAQATPTPRRWYRHPYNHVVAYRLAGALGFVPRSARLALARQLGRLASHVLPAERMVTRATLQAVTGASGERLDALTARLFGEFAMCFADLVSTNRQPAATLGRYVEAVIGADPLRGIPGGAVSVTAHVGNWELAGRLLATQIARRTHVVVTADEAPALRRWVRRDGDGLRFVPREHPRIGVALVSALRRGEIVAMQGDRAIGTRGHATIPFFGRPAWFPLGPFVLAAAARVPVVAAFCVLGPTRRYTVRLEPPIHVERGAEEAAARTWVASLERVVRDYPTQWFNFFDVWSPFAA